MLKDFIKKVKTPLQKVAVAVLVWIFIIPVFALAAKYFLIIWNLIN